ncbi:hypothetical protein LCGC14_2311040 [marine sediment metagenome]|uniref:Integrase catalytic domain-containing protein n=1 Tax=marine sediment metagenome TaxID=412755 RepID=A0A0F9CKP3_9ZZZZ
MAYARLSLSDRQQIFKGIAQGKSLGSIAKGLGRARSTISREVQRSDCKEDYCPLQAQADADIKAKHTLGKRKIDKTLRVLIEHRLTIRRQSPEQIAADLKRKHPNTPSFHLCHETIYRFLYEEIQRGRTHLVRYLRRRKKKRGGRSRSQQVRGKIPNATSIHDRPPEVETRVVAGHWEGDLIIGKDHKSALGTLVERTTRYTLLVPLGSQKDSISVTQAFGRALSKIPDHLKKSLTYDRGAEMTRHQEFTASTGIPVYFADPHSPGQRGTNENTNGLVREFLPKRTDFSKVHPSEIRKVQDLLNMRPRKVLGYWCPYETMAALKTA